MKFYLFFADDSGMQLVPNGNGVDHRGVWAAIQNARKAGYGRPIVVIDGRGATLAHSSVE